MKTNRDALLLLAGFTLVSMGAAPAVHVPSAQNVKVVDVIPRDWSDEANQDSEPFLSVDAADPSRMVVSAFARDRRPGKSPSAPVFVSVDGGSTWTHAESVPISKVTVDITHAFARRGILQAGALTVAKTPRGLRPDLVRLTAQDSVLLKLMHEQGRRADVDQPFVATFGRGSRDTVYMGENFLGSTTAGTAAIEVSRDGGATFSQSMIESRPVDMQDGPSIRLAVADDGKAYASYFGWREFKRVDDDEGWVRSDVVVVRDDNVKGKAQPFSDLQDPDDKKVGRIVKKNVPIHWSNKETLGRERTGSTLSLAVDPAKSSTVYIAWADNVGAQKEYTIHVQRSTNSGLNWENIHDFPSATCVALAVAGNGTLGVLYQRFIGDLKGGKWETHLVQTPDGFKNPGVDVKLADVPGGLSLQFLPYLGDYNFMLTVGREFRGVFAANNYPDRKNFPKGVSYLREADWDRHLLGNGHGGTVGESIDPFYFSVPVVENATRPWKPEVSTASSVAKPATQARGRVHAMASPARGPSEEEALKSRLKQADVVVAGTVMKIRDAGATYVARGGRLQAAPTQGRPRISEHNPHWKEAVFRVEDPLQGLKTGPQEIVVRFAASIDGFWADSPKFKIGERKVLMLKKSRTEGGALQSLENGTPLYAAPELGDVLKADQVERVKQLLRQ
jgi:hypothetical protein